MSTRRKGRHPPQPAVQENQPSQDHQPGKPNVSLDLSSAVVEELKSPSVDVDDLFKLLTSDDDRSQSSARASPLAGSESGGTFVDFGSAKSSPRSTLSVNTETSHTEEPEPSAYRGIGASQHMAERLTRKVSAEALTMLDGDASSPGHRRGDSAPQVLESFAASYEVDVRNQEEMSALQMQWLQQQQQQQWLQQQLFLQQQQQQQQQMQALQYQQMLASQQPGFPAAEGAGHRRVHSDGAPSSLNFKPDAMMFPMGPAVGAMPAAMGAMGMNQGVGMPPYMQMDQRTPRCYNCENYGHISRLCPFPCSYCRMPGHWSGICHVALSARGVDPQEDPAGRVLRCFNCDQPGHRSVHCPQPCQYCFEPGHWSGLCPLRPADSVSPARRIRRPHRRFDPQQQAQQQAMQAQQHAQMQQLQQQQMQQLQQQQMQQLQQQQQMMLQQQQQQQQQEHEEEGEQDGEADHEQEGAKSEASTSEAIVLPLRPHLAVQDVRTNVPCFPSPSTLSPNVTSTSVSPSTLRSPTAQFQDMSLADRQHKHTGPELDPSQAFNEKRAQRKATNTE